MNSAVQTKESVLADCFQLLAIGLTCPDDNMTRGIIDGSLLLDMQEAMQAIGSVAAYDKEWRRCMEEIRKVSDPSGKEASAKSLLRREYTRLFSAPSNPLIPIYETLFLAPRKKTSDFGLVLIRSPEAVDAKQSYSSAGVEMTVADSPDHMKVECEFMGYLFRMLAACMEEEELLVWRKRIERFSTVHLDAWFFGFFESCCRLATHPYYRLVGMLGTGTAGALRLWENS
jgi:TorA maturation chaperone TorD